MEYIKETKINSTRYFVTAVCSPKATETVEQKLERIISRHVADVLPNTQTYQLNSVNTLDMCEKVRPYSK